MKLRYVFAATVICATTSPTVLAESVGDFIERSKEIESLDFEIERLERQLRQEELKHEIQNVGKEIKTSDPFRLSEQRIEIKDYPTEIAPQRGARTSSEEEGPSYEELVQRQHDRVLDDSFVTAVFGHANTGEMTAEIYLNNRGVVEVVEGETVGNWRITNISLRSVEATHLKNGEIRRLTAKSFSN